MLHNRLVGIFQCYHWITYNEKQRILDFQSGSSEEGRRMLIYTMKDEDVAAVSSLTTSQILRQTDSLNRYDRKPLS